MEIKAIDSHSHIGYENGEEIVGKKYNDAISSNIFRVCTLSKKKNSVEKVLFCSLYFTHDY